MSASKILLRASDLQTGYRSGRKKSVPVAGPLSLEIRAGMLICLLGPNGSGKSTLLRTLAGLQPALAGKIELEGANNPAFSGEDGYQDFGRLSPAQLARKISLVLTDRVRNNNLTVESLVALGRYPYSGWLGILGPEDQEIVAGAVSAAGVSAYLQRKVATLSDGESQKVMLARALAQDTPILMLDEPTAHLDLPSRIQLIRLLHGLAQETGKGILVSTHELDLALQVADEVWLLQAGVMHKGAPEDLVLNGTFESAFDKEGIHFDKSSGSFPIHAATGRAVSLEGDGVAAFWTRRALARKGFQVADSPWCITVSEEGGQPCWAVRGIGRQAKFGVLSGVLDYLKIHYTA